MHLEIFLTQFLVQHSFQLFSILSFLTIFQCRSVSLSLSGKNENLRNFVLMLWKRVQNCSIRLIAKVSGDKLGCITLTVQLVRLTGMPRWRTAKQNCVTDRTEPNWIMPSEWNDKQTYYTMYMSRLKLGTCFSTHLQQNNKCLLTTRSEWIRLACWKPK